MNVLLVNTYPFGGAAKACIRLHQGLLKLDKLRPKLLFSVRKGSLPPESYIFEGATTLTFPQRMEEKARRIFSEFKLMPLHPETKEQVFLKNRNPALDTFSFPNSSFDITKSALYHQADIINLHWVAKLLDFESFFKKNRKPILWTLHDMNAFAGGEHYEERFQGMDNQGYPIPRVLTPEEKKWHHDIIQLKKKALKNVQNLHIISPSNWLKEASQKSELFGRFPHSIIPYGLSMDTFQPRDKAFSRDILGLPKDKLVLLFVSDALNSTRKGFSFLKKTLETMKHPEVLLCAIGSKGTSDINSSQNRSLGVIQDELLMSIAYSAADVFIIPSLEDNLPNTVLESLACGTPIIGFPTGGIVDMVQDGENGYLCPEISTSALSETIEKFLKNPKFFDKEKIRVNALKKYDLKIQAEAYKKLYQEILNKSS